MLFILISGIVAMAICFRTGTPVKYAALSFGIERGK